MRNFEHNIQQKASDFSLEPASDSFDKVMTALEKRKKRRMIIWIWWLIPGLVISAGIALNFVFNNALPPSTQQVLNSGKHSSSFNANQSKTSNSNIYTTSEESLPTNQKPEVNTSVDPQTKTGLSNIGSQNQQSTIQPTTIHTNGTFQENKAPEQSRHTGWNEVALEKEDKMDHPIAERSVFKPVVTTSLSFQKLSVTSPGVRNTHFTYLNPKLPGFQEKFSHFSIGGYTDLGVMKSIFFENNYTSSADYTNSRKATDKFLFSYSAGLQFRYSPFKFLSFETGIGYTHFRSSQVIASSVGTWTTSGQPDPDTVMTSAFTSPSIDTKEFDNIYGYISIPLKVYYQKKWNWLGIEAGAGVIFDIPVNTYSYEADESNNLSYLRTHINESRLNRFGLQLSTNIHAVFHIKKLSLFVGPTFRYRANSMFDDQYIMKQHYYFVGGETGVRYNF